MTSPLATIAAVAIAVALLASCSDDGSSDAAPAESSESAPAPETVFAADAAALCTEIVNDAVAGPGLPSPNRVVAQVLASIAASGQAPVPVRIAWADALDRHLAHADGARARLAALAAPTSELQSQWDSFLAAYDGPAGIHRQRAAALTGGSWAEVRTAFGASSSSSEVESTLDALHLEATDCANVFSPDVVQPPAEWRQFTAAAATACTEVVNRRALAAYGDDVDRVSSAEDEVAAGEVVTSPDDVDAALGRLAAEWRQTADDFAKIDQADSPSPATWRSLGDLAAERVSIAEQRRAAIATSNDAAMAAAFAVPDYVHAGFGFELLLLEARSCGGLTT